MAKLTAEQIIFLKSQNVSPSLLYDASGLSKQERIAMMDRLEKLFYYGGAPCKAGGHTLRTKAGHCIQCDTSKIAFQLRSSAAGYVYLAWSPSTKYIKIGYSKFHPQERAEILRNEAYGKIRDWDVKQVVRLERNAGRTEFSIHAKLEPHIEPITYEKEKGVYVECREIFNCDLAHAKAVFNELTTNAAL